MKSFFQLLSFAIHAHKRFFAGVWSALLLFWAVFWYGGIWDKILDGRSDIHIGLGVLALALLYSLSAYVAYFFHPRSQRSLLMQLPVSRTCLLVMPFLLATFAGGVLYLLFERAWRVGFLIYGMPSSFFLLFLPFLTVAAVMCFRRVWLGMAVAAAIAFLTLFVYGIWLVFWLHLLPRLESEVALIPLTLAVLLIFLRKRALVVAPFAFFIFPIIAGISLSRTAGDYMEAVELVYFHASARNVAQLKRLAVEKSGWDRMEKRHWYYAQMQYGAVVAVETYLTDEERIELVRNAVEYREAFTEPGENPYHIAYPIAASQVPDRGSEYLRALNIEPKQICDLVAFRRSWENMHWYARTCSFGNLLSENIPGIASPYSKWIDELYTGAFTLLPFGKAQRLVAEFFEASRKQGMKTESEYRSVSSKRGVNLAEWSDWKKRAWSERSKILAPLLEGDPAQIRAKILDLPTPSRKDCREKLTLLRDLCTRVGESCRGEVNLRAEEVTSFAYLRLRNSLRGTACTGLGSYFWRYQEIILKPENLLKLQAFGRELASSRAPKSYALSGKSP